jgi:hypothetical protein
MPATELSRQPLGIASDMHIISVSGFFTLTLSMLFSIFSAAPPPFSPLSMPPPMLTRRAILYGFITPDAEFSPVFTPRRQPFSAIFTLFSLIFHCGRRFRCRFAALSRHYLSFHFIDFDSRFRCLRHYRQPRVFADFSRHYASLTPLSSLIFR